MSLDLRPQLANLQTWQNNVDASTGRMSVAQSALTQIQSIGANFYAQLNNVESVDASEVDSIAASARDALKEVAGLLDTQDGGVYVFAGQDTGNPPVPDPDNILASGFYSQINAAIGGLSPTVNNAATVAQTTFDACQVRRHASPFSTYLTVTPSPSLPTVQVGQNQTETTGISASANGLIPVSQSVGQTIPGGPLSTTGSYMRDVLRALATIGSLSSGQASEPGFRDLVQDTRISLSNAVSAMAQDAGVLGNVQSSLTTTQSQSGRYADGNNLPGILGRGRRYGGNLVATLSGADADAGVVSADRHAERSVVGEIPAGLMMKTYHVSPAVNSMASGWRHARKKRGHA